MIKSMTGYGKAACRLGTQDFTVEVRSLNGKNLDINIKIPPLFKDKEQEIRSLMAEKLVRGKNELFITMESQAGAAQYVLNKELIRKYYQELSSFSKEVGAPLTGELLPAILKFPEVLQQDNRRPDDSEWLVLLAAIEEALERVDAFRMAEGASLKQDLDLRINNIGGLLESIAPLEGERTEALRQKLQKAAGNLKNEQAFDSNRFEQEMMYYFEKLDITEEKVRLAQHLEYFKETTEAASSSGKKLGFIAQEIGREINTLGSKANDAGIQKIVVEMKDELEKIKEQLLNIL
ncbi:MAG: YicC/YloC family endoribonuclease [Bacteroidales bacterium]|nr:YicC/YloC family endoribonuclease [Bacteroidales bacterium]